MKIYIGADHAGVKLKQMVRDYLSKWDIVYEDIGSFDEGNKDDYPDFALKVAEKISGNLKEESKGILICGSGTGMVIVANKIKGIRAAMVYDSYSAKKSREDNNSNIICLRSRGISNVKNIRLIKLFLDTNFSNGERHIRRINKITKIERKR